MIHARSSQEDVLTAPTTELVPALITCDGFGAGVKKTALAALLLRVGGFPAVEAVLGLPGFGEGVDAPPESGAIIKEHFWELLAGQQPSLTRETENKETT